MYCFIFLTCYIVLCETRGKCVINSTCNFLDSTPMQFLLCNNRYCVIFKIIKLLRTIKRYFTLNYSKELISNSKKQRNGLSHDHKIKRKCYRYKLPFPRRRMYYVRVCCSLWRAQRLMLMKGFTLSDAQLSETFIPLRMMKCWDSGAKHDCPTYYTFYRTRQYKRNLANCLLSLLFCFLFHNTALK